MSADALLADLAHEFAERHPRESGQVLLSLTGDEARAFLAAAPTETAAAILEQISIAAGGHYVEDLPPADAARLLTSLTDERAVDLLRDIDLDRREPVLREISGHRAERLRDMLGQEAGTVGAIMRQRPPSVQGGGSVAQVLDELRRQRLGAIPYVYLVDRQGVLSQVITLGDLVAADGQTAAADLAQPADARLRVDSTINAALEYSGWQQHASLPVVDARGVLVGGLEYRALLRHRALADAESTDDSVGASLGELYRLGLAGFLQAATGGGRNDG